MSFGGGFGGFGSNNNTTQQTGFGAGGFGANNTANNTGFGGTTNTGFGATNTGGGLFGGGNTGTTGAFGSGGTGFGSTNNNAFGAKPGGFGATASSGGMFGSNTATAGSTGFGGFGATNTTSSPFGGGNNTGGGLFGGQNKTAFGATPAASNPFGGAATSSPFGGGTTGAFGAPQSTALATAGAGECQGTGSVQFTATVEKEPNSSSNQQNAFQSICFQLPYQKFSPEELRLADYAQGRRYGNTNQQTGAFGASNFGGFGATQQPATTGFGAQPAATNAFGGGASTGFGATQPASTGFGGAANGGGLFGAKPAATGGLFGSTPAAPSTGGGLFGAAQPAAQPSGGLFGNNTAAQSSGGLFGNNNAAKSTFSFGSSTAAAPTTGFGATASTGGFGGGGGLFGNNNNQQTTTTGFGATAQPAAASTGFGGFGANNNTQQTGGLFGGANQAKPAGGGLFGSTPAAANTGGGLFGGTQPAANTNPFGTSTATQNTGSLFGAKPAATTGGLFGNTQQTNPSGGSLFGGFGNNQNQPQQQATGGGLFGATNNQPKPGGLFGGSTGTQQGGGLFGNTGNQQSGGLFGGSTNNGQQQQQQQQPQGSAFGSGNSLFNTSQQQNQQTPQSLTASINDTGAYGTASFFSGLASTQVTNPGPIATPLSSSVKVKKAAALPMYKLSSTPSSRYSTPQKRPGYGFSYSNYNTPGSATSTASTPGVFNNSLLGAGSFGRSLNKSMSTSSLRRSFNTEDSILAPGAFSSSPNTRHFGSTGSVKKLTISRGLRPDLFNPPDVSQSSQSTSQGLQSSIRKKRVSFGSDITLNGHASGSSSPLKTVNNGGSNPDGVNGDNGTGSSSPEMEQVAHANNQLAIVREEEVAPVKQSKSKTPSDAEAGPGQYWMKPSKEEIESMTHEQRKAVVGFTIGRDNVGHVKFEEPVDLSKMNLDEIFDNTVLLELRSATVYPNAAKKPPPGKGLNVHSTITLEHSWPRAQKNKKKVPDLQKHIQRLKDVEDTKFVSYDKKTGVWVFTVDHYTTYGLPEDEEDEMDVVSDFGQSTLSAPPDTPTPKNRTPKSSRMEESFVSDSQMTYTESDPEDTFEFRTRNRTKKAVPGAFDDDELYDDENMDGDYDEPANEESFLDERSVGSQSENGVEEPMDQDDVFQDDESVSIVDQEMAGSFPEADNTAELYDSQVDEDMDVDMATPGAVLRARQRALKSSETPVKRKFAAGDDWATTLQATVSPKKQDRALLKSIIETHGEDYRIDAAPTPLPRRVVSAGFANHIELHKSLFGPLSPVKAKIPAEPKGFKKNMTKRSKIGEQDMSSMTETDRAFHDSMKPRWGPDGTLVYAAPPNTKPFGRSSRYAREGDGLLTIQKGVVVSEHRDIRFAKFSDEASAIFLKKHKEIAVFGELDGVPSAQLPDEFSFIEFFEDRAASNPVASHEKLVWQLASVLFDDIDIPENLQQVPNIEARLRKDKLSVFWQKLVDESTTKHVALAKSKEEKAIASLSGHRVADACGQLVSSGDYHLATLVALIGSRDSLKNDMHRQLIDWGKTEMLEEFHESIRAVYELLAGNVCTVRGFKGKTSTFAIAKRFGLDWRQAFGLRLWYSISTQDPIQEAVERFDTDLRAGRESVKPQSWYVEQKVPTLWDDESIEQREDLLWGLLKIHTFNEPQDELVPENSQLSPLDTRLTWQLRSALIASGKLQRTSDDDDDRITLSFAAQLTNEGSWLDAVFVLLHLTSANARSKCIQSHLAQHAGLIGSEDSQSFITLSQTFQIPTSWIWEAQALYMRSVERNPIGEVECLIKAGSFNEAHRTFARQVAPQAIVEFDYNTLRTLLLGFKGKETSITEWHLGGEIYEDFLELHDNVEKKRDLDDLLVERLLAGLPAVVQDSRHPSFMETVAVETISGEVAKAVIAMSKKGEKSNLHKVLRLPLTEDRYLKHTVELSLEYYRGVMASAR